MASIEEFIRARKVSQAVHPVTAEELDLLEVFLEVKPGPQLREYLLRYGFLGYHFARLFGLNRDQGPKSDMVRETQTMHKNHSKTAGLIALEDQGDGDYYLVDGEDRVFHLFPGSEEPKLTGMDLGEYVVDRFTTVEEYI